jgi:putative ubiquitin-RnfH superfamily antitoxin RatB of RatAB toxin-antitoxin module
MAHLENEYLVIDVCLGSVPRPQYVNLALPPGSTIKHAVLASKLIPEAEIGNYRIGIYGEFKALETVLNNYDRVEIYTPLQVDPKTARALRVKQMRLKNPNAERKWRTDKSTE